MRAIHLIVRPGNADAINGIGAPRADPIQMHTYTRHIRDHGPPIGSAREVEEALSAIWAQQRDRTDERVAVLERAVAELQADRLDAELHGEAQRAAHQLAGTVGIFGFRSASRAAGRLEVELERPTPARAPALSALLQRIREDLAIRPGDRGGCRAL